MVRHADVIKGLISANTFEISRDAGATRNAAATKNLPSCFHELHKPSRHPYCNHTHYLWGCELQVQ